ncbi:MAG: hypothetical protein HY551_01045 [Elusimicrobia bacterium]|nr:hypothetical protein [Elusimicrobiota bacterium]
MAIPTRLHQLLGGQLRSARDGFFAMRTFIGAPSLQEGRHFNDVVRSAGVWFRQMEEFIEGDSGARSLRGQLRVDLFRLGRMMEDLSGTARAIVEEMLWYRVDTDEFLRKMANSSCESCDSLAAAWKQSRSMPSGSSECVVRAKKANRQVFRFFREGERLVLGHPEVLKRLKIRAVYRHFSDAAHRADEAADIIESFVVQGI